MNIKGSKDLHDVEIKIRLTERQAKMLEAISEFYDIPKAVVARKIIHQGMSATHFAELTDDRLTA